MIECIAVDLDNTLLDDKARLMPKSAAALKRAANAGVHVVIATTRNYKFAQVLGKLLGFKSPIIAVNGAVVSAAAGGPMLAYHTIPLSLARKIAELSDKNGWEPNTLVGERTYWKARPSQQAGMLFPTRFVVERAVDALAEPPSRILFWNEVAADVLRPKCEQSAECRTETYLDPDGSFQSFGIFPKLADKGTALRMVLAHLGISAENTLAIGDNFNDVSMFGVAGVSVAMGNAVAAVKDSADYVAPPFNEDGVAWAVEKLAL